MPALYDKQISSVNFLTKNDRCILSSTRTIFPPVLRGTRRSVVLTALISHSHREDDLRWIRSRRH